MKKLVRDKIPELFNFKNIYVADDSEYSQALISKLQEEVNEFKKDNNAEELADIIEVIHAIAKNKGISVQEVEKIREKKANERGKFDNKIIWKGEDGK